MRTYQAYRTNVFDRNERATKPVVANIGGADSSKSHSIAQLMIQKFFNERNKSFLICRKTLPSLKLTAYRLVINLLKEYGNYRRLKHNKSEHTITAEEFNNFLVFLSIDDVEKIKSTEFNYIWMEEAGEFTWEDFIILYLRLRAKTDDGNPNRMYLSFNPVDEQGWINQELFKQNYVEKIHSTYMDNDYAAAVDIKVLEGLKGQDESYWKIYALGQFAKLKGLIHELIEIPELPESKEVIYGLDFGFTAPSTLIEVGIDMEQMALYLRELIYETHLTNSELIDLMKEAIPEKHRGREIYADSAEPDRIEEIHYAGFNVHESNKSITDGIDCVNRFKLYTVPENTKLNPDMRTYKRKVDRKGEIQEEPVKFHDHGPNAVRYATYTHLRDRLLELDPVWTLHSGEKEEEEEAEEKKAVREPVSDERDSPKPWGHGTPQGKPVKEKKKPEPDKEERDDQDWAV